MSVHPDFTLYALSQFNDNRCRNLFYKHDSSDIGFSESTRVFISEKHQLIREMVLAGETDVWVSFLTREAVKTIYAANQYIQTREEDLDRLRDIYSSLIGELTVSSSREHLDEVSLNHVLRLGLWLEQTDPLLKEMYAGSGAKIVPVVCAEYSPEFLLRFLGLDVRVVEGPVLDIGCGSQALLVNYLRQQQIEAFGFDRVVDQPNSWLFERDWFEFEFKPDAWGTIIANQSFSLHFHHFNLRQGDQSLLFARLYMRILNALRPGGRFVYAPSLPFIEPMLPPGRFRVSSSPCYGDFGVTIVEKVS